MYHAAVPALTFVADHAALTLLFVSPKLFAADLIHPSDSARRANRVSRHSDPGGGEGVILKFK